VKLKGIVLNAVFLIGCSILLAFFLTRTPAPPPAEPDEKLEPDETELWQKRNFAATPVNPLDRKEPGPSVTQEKETPRGDTDLSFDEEKFDTDFYKQSDNHAMQRLALFCVAMLALAAYPIVKIRRSMARRVKPAKRRLPRRELTMREWAAGRRTRATEEPGAEAPNQTPILLFRPSPPSRRECE
jgi:hypothetical protein